MRIRLKGHANVRHYFPGSLELLDMDIADGTDLAAILQQLKIPESEIMLLVINNRPVLKDHIPAENDCIELFPILSGG